MSYSPEEVKALLDALKASPVFPQIVKGTTPNMGSPYGEMYNSLVAAAPSYAERGKTLSNMKGWIHHLLSLARKDSEGGPVYIRKLGMEDEWAKFVKDVQAIISSPEEVVEADAVPAVNIDNNKRLAAALALGIVVTALTVLKIRK